MMNESYGYGLWGTVLASVLTFCFFTYAIIKPARKREWRNLGVLQAFFVALYAEMFGFPLTIFVLHTVFGVRFPTLNPFAHESGHLLATLGFGVGTAAAVCRLGSLFMFVGLALMAAGWYKIVRARDSLVVDGIYRHVRHPQYTGLFLIILGMLVQWPTIPTVVMGPVLLIMYYRLAFREEKDLLDRYGDEYVRYRDRTPAFLPDMGRLWASKLSY